MPYISQNERKWYVPELNHLEEMVRQRPGHLNYILTRIVTAWLGTNPGYTEFNAAIGVLSCMIQELYRRLVSPYEDKKIKEHGDVF